MFFVVVLLSLSVSLSLSYSRIHQRANVRLLQPLRHHACPQAMSLPFCDAIDGFICLSFHVFCFGTWLLYCSAIDLVQYSFSQLKLQSQVFFLFSFFLLLFYFFVQIQKWEWRSFRFENHDFEMGLFWSFSIYSS